MKTESDLLYHDFQGWPIYRMNLREIFEDLVEIGIIEKSQIQGIDQYIIKSDNPYLDSYPEIAEDDGMGYCPKMKYICNVQGLTLEKDTFRLWVDSFDSKLKENEQNKKLVNGSTEMD